MDERPRNLKTMLSEAKDTSELMIDLAYAALYFGDPDMAEEVDELEEHLSELVHEMRAVSILAARSPRDADAMASVLQVEGAIERLGNAAVDISRIVTHRLGIPRALVADLAAAEEVSHRVKVRDGSEMAMRSLRDLELPTELGMRVVAIRREHDWITDVDGDQVVLPGDVLFLQGTAAGIAELRALAGAPEWEPPQAAEEIGDAAQQMVWLVEEDEELHPILAIALGDAEEVVVRVPVADGSQADGRSLKELQLETETGFYLLAIRRGGRYLYRPRRGVVLQANDELIATGPDEGHPLLAELCGYPLIEDDETGEEELVPTAAANGR